ncbi:antibiotic biosynthesis monooxygenase [Actinoplanes sp. NPDC049316]|uniref:antibiotic biosynthesis monooxygenase family protein n=1 Tax=Actinoplanes sp. NPDC049316 TaxID=3154727 RepID=UPI00343D1E55
MTAAVGPQPATTEPPAAGPQRARVMLYCRAGGADRDRVVEAYHEISRSLAGTPGMLGNELLRDVLDPESFVVLSEWESLEAFRSWESGSQHRGTTSPLRPFQDHSRGRPFGLYGVDAAY